MLGKIAHSAMLVRIHQQYFLVEYMDDGKVYKHPVPAKDVRQHTFVLGGKKWNKQRIGDALDQRTQSVDNVV